MSMSQATERREFVEPLHLRGVSRQLARHWTNEPVEFVRNFDNLVYRTSGSPRMYLRITPDSHRSTDQIQSELEVMLHVGDCGVAVGRPVVSRSGDLIHSVTVGGSELLACVFEEAPGVPYEMNRPEFAGGSIPWEDWSHGKDEQVFSGSA
jgi:hypothetical protein